MADIANGGNEVWSTWKEDKTKTCKCEGCGERVQEKSIQCSKCDRRICSDCLNPKSAKSDRDKDFAKFHRDKNCFCRYRGNMDPEFAAKWRTHVPPKRTEEERRARESKGLAAISRRANANTSKGRKAAESRYQSPDLVDDETSGQSGDEYVQRKVVKLTVAAKRQQRQGLKRKNYQDEESGDDLISAGPSKKQRISALVGKEQEERIEGAGSVDDADDEERLPAHLVGETTVIVGAGVVGLFIAREIATQARHAGIEHHVVVIELRKSYCGLASRHCAGFLSTNKISEDWDEIANTAKMWWLEIHSSDLREKLDFDDSIKFQIVQGAANEEDKLPSWLREDAQYSLFEHDDAIGRINPSALAIWLYEQCELLGVEFCFNSSVTKVDLTLDSQVSGVHVRNTYDDVESGPGIPCSNLVLAAGPFTSGIFNGLFPNTPVKLENHVQSSDWFHVQTTAVDLQSATALSIPDAATSEERLDNEIVMIANATNNTIAISGTTTHIRHKDLDSSLAIEPSHGKISELKAVAANYLDAAHVDMGVKKNIVRRGRSELSIANDMRPIIKNVSTFGIGIGDGDAAEDRKASGVWLCYGFGKYGTMLAPGAAYLLVSKMFDGDSLSMGEDDDSRLLEDGHPRDEVKGKGKGKAKMRLS